MGKLCNVKEKDRSLMAVPLKHRQSATIPRMDGIQDPNLVRFLNDMSKIIRDSFSNIYDDLSRISTSAVVDSIYFGSPTANGTWRIIPSGVNLSIQRMEAGIWVEKDSITP